MVSLARQLTYIYICVKDDEILFVESSASYRQKTDCVLRPPSLGVMPSGAQAPPSRTQGAPSEIHLV